MIHRLVAAIVPILLAICAFATAQNPVTPPPVVAGVVTNQLTGGPVAQAYVTLTPMTGSPVGVATDQNGRFAVHNARPGQYKLTLTKNGFFRPPRSGRSSITLGSDQPILGLRLQLAPTAAILGQIMDKDRRPVAGATVAALRIEYDNHGRRVLLPPRTLPDWSPGSPAPEGAQVVTDRRGQYRLFGLEPGAYYVGAWPQLDRQAQGGIGAAQYYPGVIDIADAAAVTVRPGAEMHAIDVLLADEPRYTISFNAVAPPCPFGTIPRLFEIVRRSGELRVSYGTYRSFEGPPLLPNLPANDAVSPFKRIGNEHWVSPPLHRGSYDIFYSSCYLSDGPLTFGHRNVYLRDENADAGTMDLQSSVPLQGRVSFTQAAAQLLGTRRVGVQVLDFDDRSPFFLPFAGRLIGAPPFLISADGTFEFPVSVGRYAISLFLLPTELYIASVRVGGREVRDTGLDVSMPLPGPAMILVDGPGGIVEGLVSNAKKEPVEEAQVVIIPAPNRRENPTLFKTATTDALGRFAVAGMAPGDYSLLAWEELTAHAYKNPTFLNEVERRAVKVTVERASVHHVDLTIIPTN